MLFSIYLNKNIFNMNIYIYIYAYFGGGIGRISLKLKIVTYKEWWERVEGRQDFSLNF